VPVGGVQVEQIGEGAMGGTRQKRVTTETTTGRSGRPDDRRREGTLDDVERRRIAAERFARRSPDAQPDVATLAPVHGNPVPWSTFKSALKSLGE
jgi:hypothetical protein